MSCKFIQLNLYSYQLTDHDNCICWISYQLADPEISTRPVRRPVPRKVVCQVERYFCTRSLKHLLSVVKISDAVFLIFTLIHNQNHAPVTCLLIAYVLYNVFSILMILRQILVSSAELIFPPHLSWRPKGVIIRCVCMSLPNQELAHVT